MSQKIHKMWKKLLEVKYTKKIKKKRTCERENENKKYVNHY